MRIHTDHLTREDFWNASRFARVDFDRFNLCGSRSRLAAWDITLTGESRRRPNNGSSDAYAATWDQWGVFLGFLFYIDPDMITPPYRNSSEFHVKTDFRFDGVWPADAHGDHTFRYHGSPGEQDCTKCNARKRWTA